MGLSEQLERIREGAAERIPADSIAVMHRVTEELRTSGIMDRVLRVGDRMPAFHLENTRGETVSSADLLAKGPLVVSFFRGKW
ncbi:MAG: redoxin domain-containing protein [Gemmatimonadetes bacterium]|nr:redoxin domain-containing protein [Gemmatimonadota bacterium]